MSQNINLINPIPSSPGSLDLDSSYLSNLKTENNKFRINPEPLPAQKLEQLKSNNNTHRLRFRKPVEPDQDSEQ